MRIKVFLRYRNTSRKQSPYHCNKRTAVDRNYGCQLLAIWTTDQ